jgi:glycosyltransferase involved in cell wall biosynthesis
MKVVVFAHTPPPFHGQSYMVKLMLDGLRERERLAASSDLQLFHVDTKLSSDLEAIGEFQWSKLVLLLKYCARAYSCRFAHGADTLYYVPAPGLRAALYRDWIVMFFCRPVFKKLVLHWHAVGLGKWLDESAKSWEKKITRWLLGDVDLSIVLSEVGRADAMQLSPRKIAIVPNGIPDPCPEFEEVLLAERERRFRERHDGIQTRFKILFIGACSTAKGLFATIDAVALFNQRLTARKSSIAAQLTVAGDFLSREERELFDHRILQSDLSGGPAQRLVIYRGNVQSDAKNALFCEADCLCFPTRYAAEGQPVTIIEALAFGLPIIATRWRGIPELLHGAEARLINNPDPVAIADALERIIDAGSSATNRDIFLKRYCLDKYLEGLKEALAAIG